MTAGPLDLAAALKAEAKQLGFDLVGICDARPFARDRTYLEQRRSRGIEPNPFEAPDLEARVNPQHVLPGVQSIVSVAMSYLMPDEPDEPTRPSGADGGVAAGSSTALAGWFSRYCRGLDYHAVLEQRLAALATWLEVQAPGTHSVVHVDVGAPLDRAIAQRAGLGRFGKSTNLIARGFGTWTFLGEILTTACLAADEEATWNVCGTCTRCLDACPTGCLTPWQIDSTRCLGFVNQQSGDIPLEFRAMMGDRLFGCDDCQDVCPYNRTAARGLHHEFAARPSPGFIELLDMGASEFKARIGPTAAAWRGLRTLQRNALVALGNSGDVDALPPLVERLSHASPRLRLHAAWGIGRLVELVPTLAAAAVGALAERLNVENDQSVKEEIRLALDLIEASPAGRQVINIASPKL